MKKYYAIGLLIMLTLAGCGGRSEKPNILFITLDTHRWDYLSATGNKVVTPAIDTLAKEGALFTNTIVHAPLTLPSHSSLFTSLYPMQHGVRNNGIFILDDAFQTMAEIMREQGYSTGAAIGAYVLNARFGIAQGFDNFVNVYGKEDFDAGFTPFFNEIAADEVIRRGTKILEEFPKRNPWFLWLHFFDIHAPHRAPEPYRSMYRHDNYAGEVAYVDAELEKFFNYLKEKKLWDNLFIVLTSDHGEGLWEHNEPTHAPFVYNTTMRVATIIRGANVPKGARTDARIRNVDIMPTMFELLGVPTPEDIEGKSFRSLIKNEPYKEPTIYIETYSPYYQFKWSYLRGIVQNGWKYILAPKPELYNLNKDPNELNNLIDAEDRRAQNMKQLLLKTISESPSKAAVAEIDPETKRRLLSLGYFSSHARIPEDADEHEIKNLPDPKDKIHIFQKLFTAYALNERGEQAKAAEAIEKVIKEEPEIPVIRRHLAMIYRDLENWDKAVVHLDALARIEPAEAWLADIWKAFIPYDSKGDADKTAELLQKFVEENCAEYPHLSDGCRDANAFLAKYYADKGDIDSAREILKSPYLGEAEGTSPVILAETAGLFIQAMLYEEAEARLKNILKIHPDFANAHFQLGNLYRDVKNVRQAIQSYQKAIELEPEHIDAKINLGNLYGMIGNLAFSNQYLENAFVQDPDHPKVLANLGVNYYREGKKEKALKMLERAIEVDPKIISARLTMVQIRLDERNIDAALAICRKVLEIDPQSKEAQLVLERFGAPSAS